MSDIRGQDPVITEDHVLSVWGESGRCFVGRISSKTSGRTSFHTNEKNVVVPISIRGKGDQFTVRRPNRGSIVSRSRGNRLSDTATGRTYKNMPFKAQSAIFPLR